MVSLLIIKEPEATPNRPQPPAATLALWQLGFRPFYLLAALFSGVSIALWAAQYTGGLGFTYLAGPQWHAHEMLFGYALAVLVGFLFTAGRNWTGQPTPTGRTLQGLVLLWVAARLAPVLPYGAWAAVVGVAFPLAAASALARALWAARSRRNYFFVGLLVLLALADLGFHLTQLGMWSQPASVSLQMGLDVMLFIMVVMAGRVMPMFTNNGVLGVRARSRKGVDVAALTLVGALGVADALGVQGSTLAVLALVAAVAHGVRLWGWQPWRTRAVPLVWVLHVAYAWLVLHLLLRGAAALAWVSATSATHALTAGALACLTVGMMTRTTRGHTARHLKADGFDLVCYGFMIAAGLFRVGWTFVFPNMWRWGIGLAGLCWVMAMGIFVLRYGPMLLRARLDGRPG